MSFEVDVTHRELVRTALLSALLFTASACFDPLPGPAEGVLRVAIESAPKDLDPRLAVDQASTRACQLIYNGLVLRDENLAVQPDLAQSWDVSEDGLTYRFSLREGVRFHDGRVLGAEDVVKTLESVLAADAGDPIGRRRGDLSRVTGVEASGPFEVTVHLSEPDAPLLSNLAFFMILPGGEGPASGAPAVGTGPWKLARHEPGLSLDFERHEDFFRGPPELTGLTLRVLGDASAIVSGLRAGDVDLVINDLPAELVDVVLADPDFEMESRAGVNYAYVIFNLDDPILSDVRVRKAIAHALDRDALIQYLLRGRARPAKNMLSDVSWAHADGVTEHAHDPELAKRLLDEAGHPDPPGDAPRFSLEFKTSSSSFARRQAEVLKESLRAVGIDVVTRSFEWGTYYDDLRHGRFQVTAGRWIGITDPDVYRLRFHTEHVPENGGLNRGRFSHPEVDRLVEEGLTTVERSARADIYRRVQEVLAEELPYVSLYHLDNIAVRRRSLEGVALNPVGDFHLLWKARFRSAG